MGVEKDEMRLDSSCGEEWLPLKGFMNRVDSQEYLCINPGEEPP